MADKAERVTTAIRIPRDLHERLVKEAEDREVSINVMAVKALERYVSRLPDLREVLEPTG